MNIDEIIGKLNMIYTGDRNALEEMIGYCIGLQESNIILKVDITGLQERNNKVIVELENQYKNGFISEHTKETMIDILEGKVHFSQDKYFTFEVDDIGGNDENRGL